MIPPELEADAHRLRELRYSLDLVQEGDRVYVLFHKFRMGPHFSIEASDLLVYTTVMYPNAGFDMFWVSPEVLLMNNRSPQNADNLESYLGRQWRRFSWHLNRPWNPARDSLLSWISVVEQRLARGV